MKELTHKLLGSLQDNVECLNVLTYLDVILIISPHFEKNPQPR